MGRLGHLQDRLVTVLTGTCYWRHGQSCAYRGGRSLHRPTQTPLSTALVTVDVSHYLEDGAMFITGTSGNFCTRSVRDVFKFLSTDSASHGSGLSSLTQTAPLLHWLPPNYGHDHCCIQALHILPLLLPPTAASLVYGTVSSTTQPHFVPPPNREASVPVCDGNLSSSSDWI